MAKDIEKAMTKEETEKIAKSKVDPMEEYVEIELFKDNDKYQDDVVVTVNGERCQIQRSVPVRVKRKFLEVIRNAERQKKVSDSIIRELTGN